MNNLIVPHVKQSQESSCGAAALSMVYKYLRVNTQTEDVIWKRLKVSRPNTNSQYYLRSFDMARDSTHQGLSYFIAQAVLDTPSLALQPVKEFLSLSIPVIVSQKISNTNEWGHFRFITNINEKYVVLNDPMDTKPGTKIEINDFISLWKANSNGEVAGGQFLAIFKKEQLKKRSTFTVFTFESSIKYFNATKLEFK